MSVYTYTASFSTYLSVYSCTKSKPLDLLWLHNVLICEKTMPSIVLPLKNVLSYYEFSLTGECCSLSHSTGQILQGDFHYCPRQRSDLPSHLNNKIHGTTVPLNIKQQRAMVGTETENKLSEPNKGSSLVPQVFRPEQERGTKVKPGRLQD